MNRKELNKLKKEELIEECLELQDDNAWWRNRYNAEHKIAFENFKPRLDKATKWIFKHISSYNCKGIIIFNWDSLSNPKELLEILGDKENE